MTDTDDNKIIHLYDRLYEASEQDTIKVQDVVSAIGTRSMIPFMLVPAFVAATPLSGIPGLSSVCGLMIALVAFRMLLNYDTMALPGWIEQKTVPGYKLKSALEKSRPVVQWIDRHSHQRWARLFRRPVIWVPQTLCLMTGLLMPFLEIIPFTGSVAATAVCLLALSMMVRDGLFFLIALLPYAALIGLFVTQVM
ncbi:exopolysaccharide biosynthesis protein [Roseicitreum antarcticum]|uniref:Uncharacterized conserved protein n=1 Tax=Roseicitreum antarcticum TaxID=564137 RepID=A0A1H2VH58_9RHOB|nr:exopolysaccharide biosynthesis protein [Roseicitreum antarcticum]SDW67608.1 Uncharacterized conserved protein [Roseicitreum antarcticum]